MEATGVEGGREAAACGLEAGAECNCTDCEGDWVRDEEKEGGREGGRAARTLLSF